MFEIDKEKFGAFVAQLRKEKNLTQKELAEKLYLSDKAVSKWERGLSMPDITILTPLAETLGVTVAELLNCQRMPEQSLPTEQVDVLMKKVISFRDDTVIPPWKRWKHWLILGITWLIVGIEWMTLLYMKHDASAMSSEMGTFLLLSAIFGVYFWLLIFEKLPKYYDENRISYYYSNGFKMNIPGVSLNNSNWPRIVKTVRWWCVYEPISVPLIYALVHYVEFQTGVGIIWGRNMSTAMLILLLYSLLTLFLPLIYVGKKYQR